MIGWLAKRTALGFTVAGLLAAGALLRAAFGAEPDTATAPPPAATVTLPASPGPAGPQGPRGPTGPSGPRGATGARGPAGADGTTGGIGIPGQPGPPGVAGLPGPPGVDGQQGPRGARGPRGQRGRRGAPAPATTPGACPVGFTFQTVAVHQRAPVDRDLTVAVCVQDGQ